MRSGGWKGSATKVEVWGGDGNGAIWPVADYRWDFGGDAIINTNKHVRLTQDKQSQSGWIWSRMPLTVTNWQVEFEFKVEGKSNTIGDGFAMWLTRDRATPGPVFGNQDFFTGLGIFFDTWE